VERDLIPKLIENVILHYFKIITLKVYILSYPIPKEQKPSKENKQIYKILQNTQQTYHM
jgi:hypothetical protein